ncbi:MAG: hypothetical protein P8074_24690 [Anaerolineales bacterium]|jgi:hypothetical protein
MAGLNNSDYQMNRLKTILGLTAVLLIAVFLIIKILPVRVLPATDPDFVAIETTLRTYADIQAQAHYTLDDSRLSEVLSNDLRGGLVDRRYLKSVRYMSGKPYLTTLQVGFLDVNQARWAFERKVKQLYDEAVASGRVTIPTPLPYDPSENPISIDIRGTDRDPRTHFRPDPRIVPEIRELEQATGLGATLPIPTSEKIIPMGFRILSISVVGNLAYARVDWDYGLCKDTLVKKDSSWYLIGHKIIRWHGG